MMHVLSFRDVSCRFDDQRVVDAVSLTLRPVKLFAFWGRQDAGNHQPATGGGMETPDSGEVLFPANRLDADQCGAAGKPQYRFSVSRLCIVSAFDGAKIFASAFGIW